MELVSVVVPVYNVEEYLERCIDSLLIQTYENLEIILIDDGSTDQSGMLCDALALKDNRIKVIHQKNKGLSGARNTGIDNIRGRFVTFVDSDDYVLENYIESLVRILKENDGDIAAVLDEKFRGEKVKICRGEQREQRIYIYSNEEALANMLYRKGLNSYVCGKLFKIELFDNIRFPMGVLFEDLRTIYKLYDNARKIVFCPIRLYCYYQRQGSIVNSEFNLKKMEQVTASEELLNFISQRYPQIEDAAISKLFISAVDVFRKIPKGKIYINEKKYLKAIIKKYRFKVLRDNHNKFYIRIMAVVSFANIESLAVFGRIYQNLLLKGILSGNKRI